VNPRCLDADGAAHALGDYYLGEDNCNRCKCMEFGSSCTKKLCETNALWRSQNVDDPKMLENCTDVDGTKHKLGESYIGPDGCNYCKCMEGGNACTRKLCPPDASSRKAEADKCVDNMGVLHNSTETEQYMHVDGCNKCRCMEGDKPACTKMLCLQFKENKMSKCVSHTGKELRVGEDWMHEDGCTKCICGVLGPICSWQYCRWDPVNPRKNMKKDQAGEEDGDAVVLTAQRGMVTEEGDIPCKDDDDTEHMPGDMWLSGDGCNSCTCPGNGERVCTEVGCRIRLERLISLDPGLEGVEPGSGGHRVKNSSFNLTFTLLTLSVTLFFWSF